jgi:hypothetical protein
MTPLLISTTFTGHSLSSETEKFAVRGPVARPILPHDHDHLNSDEGVCTDTDTDLALYDIHTPSQQPLRKL